MECNEASRGQPASSQGRSVRWLLLGAIVALPLLLAACGDDSGEPAPTDTRRPGATGTAVARSQPPALREPTVVDCRADNDRCPEIRISGDPWPEPLADGLSLRGYADPSIRLDPTSGRLWLSYTYVERRYVEPEVTGQFLSTHLAFSDDGGQSWQFDRALNAAVRLPTGSTLVHEVSTITRLDGGIDDSGGPGPWYYAALRYARSPGTDVTTGGIISDTVHYRLRVAPSPADLATATDVGYRSDRLAGEVETTLDLTQLVAAAGLARCPVWTEPDLFADRGTLYLLAECQEGFTVLLASAGANDVAGLEWRVLGRLPQLGPEFGSEVFTQATLARARDGALLLIGTPGFHESPVHLGCRVLEMESLDPPKLRRHPDGSLVVRAEILSTDGEPNGPGACAYDPSSETGILFVRRSFDFASSDIRFHLVATGVHP